MGKFWEHFNLNLRFIGISKRLAIVTILGLSVSIGMITQNILFLYSFRNTAFNEFVDSASTETYIEVSIDNVIWPGYNLETLLESTVTGELGDAGFTAAQLEMQEWVSYRFFYLLLNNIDTLANEFHETYMIGINAEYLPLLGYLVTEGRAPAIGEFCILTDTNTIENTNLALNNTFNAYISRGERYSYWDSYQAGIGLAGQTIGFSGIVNIDDITYSSVSIPTELQTLLAIAVGLGKEIIVTSFQTVNNLMYSILYSNYEFSVLGRIVFDLSQFSVFNLDDHVGNLQVFINRVQESLLGLVETYSINQDLSINARLLPLLANFQREYRIFQIFLMVFMLPTLGMALTLTSFASNQVKKQRDRHVNNFHQRGTSRQMLFSFMLFELIVFALLAMVIGYLIGWPYTLVALRSDGFFSFNSGYSLPKFNVMAIGISLGVGFGIAFLANIFTVWRRTKTSVEEALQEQEERKPFWERFYIDIFLLVIGLLMWIVSTTQVGGTGSTSLEFAFYFAAPAPILIIIGSIMFITRVYPAIIKWISDLIFKIPKMEISAVSARNAIRRKGSTNRTILLMTLTFTLTVASVIIPDSYRAYDYEDAYYSLGADIVVSNVDVLTPDYKQLVDSIEGVESSCYVSLLEISNSESEIVYDIQLMGIDLVNYSKVAYHEEEYTNGLGYDSLLSSINESLDVIGQKDEIDLLSLGEDGVFVVKNWAFDGVNVDYISFNLTVVNEYEYWPAIYTEVPVPTSKEIHIGLIGNLTMPYNITRDNKDVDGYLYVKVAEGYSISEISETIQQTTRRSTVCVEDILLIKEGTLKATVLFGSLNSSFIVSMLITSATLVTMMIVHGIEREKEIAVMKSMGVRFRQLFNFFISEAVIILIFTMIVGVAMGTGISVMIMKILRISTVLPEHEMIFPIIKIVWTTLAIFGCGLVSTIIPIIINTRKRIGSALKEI